MAQECMDLFDKKRLPLTANVQQVCSHLENSSDFRLFTTHSLDLRHWPDTRPQNPEEAC